MSASRDAVEDAEAELLTAAKLYVESYASKAPVTTVAVVGNAPLPVSVERSRLIDSADLVFRCNSFVLDEPGDEPCLGTKTDVVICSRGGRATPWFFRDYPSRAYLVVNNVTHSRRPRSDPVSWPPDLGFWPVPNRLFGLPLKGLLRATHESRNAIPTTGTTAAYLARRLFPEAMLFVIGFSFIHERVQTEWAHHWGTVVPVSPGHKLDREAALLQSWIDDGHAKFVV